MAASGGTGKPDLPGGIVDPQTELETALDAYVARFQRGPAVFQFLRYPAELAALMREAVARGRRLSEAETYRRLGMTQPPPGAVI
jgi:hypothetical protein